CVIHCAADLPTVIGANVTVGHMAVLEGCVIEDGALIGMGAIVLQRARVGARALIAAGAVVGEGVEIPGGVLAAGVPAKVGTALLAEAGLTAAAAGCTRLWLITTNDNVDALRFSQRRGFRLAALYPGAVDDSRARLKPEIPPVGDYGIPLRDELELELRLGP